MGVVGRYNTRPGLCRYAGAAQHYGGSVVVVWCAGVLQHWAGTPPVSRRCDLAAANGVGPQLLSETFQKHCLMKYEQAIQLAIQKRGHPKI